MPASLRRKTVQVAREFRKAPTAEEGVLWTALRGRQLGGVRFRRQQPIGPFVVDLFAPAARLVVEVDGPIHKGQRKLDVRRQSLLESLGLRFLRVSTEEVQHDLASVIAKIKDAVQTSPHPRPFPHKVGRASEPSPPVGEGLG